MPLIDDMKLPAIHSEVVAAVPAITMITRQSFGFYVPLVSRHPALINEMFSNYLV